MEALYTTSLDLLPIFWSQSITPTSIGDIYQEFEKPDENGKGKVKNIIGAGLPPFLEDYNGLTLTVTASYEVLSNRRITLSFERAEVSDLLLSELGKTLISPAVLPRGFVNMRLMQLIQEFKASSPLPNSDLSASNIRPTLLLTYLDETILIGRALPGSGVYILEKES